MAQWTMTDNANGAPSWANTTLNLAKNRNELFGNTTIGTFRANIAYGTFGVSSSEMTYANTASTEADIIPHAGWVLRTQGEGGRAGRIQYEVLVAASSIANDAGGGGEPLDDSRLPE
jgi:hypothetical protein